MIYQKRLDVSAISRRRIFRTFPLFAEADSGLCAKSSVGFRRRGNALVCAESAVQIATVSPTARLFRGNYTKRLFVYQNGSLYLLNGGNLQQIGQISALLDVKEFVGVTGEVELYLLTPQKLYKVSGGAVVEVDGEGGSVLGVHYERLFVANGYEIRYSAPLDCDEWTLGVHLAGKLKLPRDSGEVVAMVSYRERLYLFRERGITELRANGDDLNMKATDIPFSCGQILPKSVVNGGYYLYFCTENGFYCFNGDSCVRRGGMFPFIHASDVQATSFCGKYLVATVRNEGDRTLFCYGEEDGGYFIGVPAVCVSEDACMDGEGNVYELTARGVFDKSKGCFYESEYSMIGLSNGKKRVESVTVEGEGRMKVRICSDEGEQATVEGRAGKPFTLPRYVNGNAFSVKISTFDERVRISGIIFNILEENRRGY